jgi:regulator of RNase E activity RraB
MPDHHAHTDPPDTERHMSDDWDFYYCRVEDKPASIYLDLGAVEHAPMAALPIMAFIRLSMREPRSDGLSSQQEFGTLCAIEDHLAETLFSDDVHYVGRCTTNACRDFVFYIADAADWGERVAASLQAFPDYQYEVGAREDSAWATYTGYLYPGERDMQVIENRRVCQLLEEQGDKLQAPREISHWLSFADPQAMAAYAQSVAPMGFEVRSQDDAPDDEGQYTLQLCRTDVPGYSAINDVSLPLFDLAKAQGGSYDGWEAVLVSE